MAGEARILQSPMTPAEIAKLAEDTFGDMFKLVTDINTDRMAVGGSLHADAEELLVDEGSAASDIWGANYFPQRPAGSRLEYTALINIRPADRNIDQYIQSAAIREKVKKAVEKWIGPA